MSTTLSPTASSSTPSPIASTMPDASWPEHLGAVPEPAGEHRVVGVADAAVVHPHAHLAGRGIGDVDLVDLERARPVEQCGAQRAPSWLSGKLRS